MPMIESLDSRPMKRVRGMRNSVLTGVLLFCSYAVWGSLYPTNQSRTAPGLFSVYAENRESGRPNYVTEDLMLLSYGMIRSMVGKQLERDRYVEAVRELIVGLNEHVQGLDADDEPNRANKDFFAVLMALQAGSTEVVDAGERKRAQEELDLVLAASSVEASPLWGRTIDYTQFLPRGHYADDEELTRYFRVVRYAGESLFAIKASAATGVTDALATRMSWQALRLSQAIQDDHLLSRIHADMLMGLTWRFGPAEDLSNAALLETESVPEAEFPDRLLDYARAHGMQPRIIGGVVRHDQLEDGATLADVMTGWRFLPQHRTPEGAAFQQLVFPSTGTFAGEGAEHPPFGATVVDGKLVKGFPLLGELMSAWGSEASSFALAESGETAFEGYTEVEQRVRLELAAAEGLAAQHQRLYLSAFADEDRVPENRLVAIRAFWTWQRYASLLYAKQSYTSAGKSLVLDPPRPGASVEPSLPLYQALINVVAAHKEFTPHPSWEAFGEILDRISGIAAKVLLGQTLDLEDNRFLNQVDRDLLALTDGFDSPIAVDVHTDPTSGKVLQETTGMARLAVNRVGDIDSVGARLTQCEFKHPMDDRLTDEKWLTILEEQLEPCGGNRGPHDEFATTLPLEAKLDADLVDLIGRFRDVGADGAIADSQESGVEVTDGRVQIRVILKSASRSRRFKGGVSKLGGTVISEFDNNVYVSLPIEAIEHLARMPAVWRADIDRTVAEIPATEVDASGRAGMKVGNTEADKPQAAPNRGTVAVPEEVNDQMQNKSEEQVQ